MANAKFDGLIEAVRYAPDGKIEMVRAYERRGSTFSDIILIHRDDLIARLKQGQKFVTGARKEYLGSTFTSAGSVRFSEGVITTGSDTTHDNLEKVPVI